LRALGLENRVHPCGLDLASQRNCSRLLRDIQPHEIYNLAAQSLISVSFEKPVITGEITGLGVARLLEAVRTVNPEIAFFQASCNDMFGNTTEVPQSEDTPFRPQSPYAIAKLYAHWTTVNYREVYDLRASSGILFSHSSPLKDVDSVTRKIAINVARIRNGSQNSFSLGNLNTQMDWGYAPEYVEAMWMMLNDAASQDYVIATGQTCSVRDFVSLAFQAVNIDIEWVGTGENEKAIEKQTGRVVVSVDPRLFRPSEGTVLVGDTTKIQQRLGWSARTSAARLVQVMVQEDLKHTEAA
jgi:GDPmannose 4,6-dehydratase